MSDVKSIAVIGAGTMGSGIAGHLANAGVPVVLLDIVPQGSAGGAENRDVIAEAAVARSALLGAGYAGAFIVTKETAPNSAVPSIPDPTREKSAPEAALGPARDADLLAEVPDALRDRVVILDGRVHVIDGDEFIPLEVYLERTR